MPPKKTELKQDPRNARRHNDASKEAVHRSLHELGPGRSIVVDKNGVVIAGNATLEQAQELGIPTKVVKTKGDQLVVVQRDDLDTNDPKRKALAIADNRTGDLSEFDFGVLNETIEDLVSTGGDLDLESTGFTDEQMAGMMTLAADMRDGTAGDGAGSGEVDVDGIECGKRCPRCGFEYDKDV